MDHHGVDPQTLPQLQALTITPGRPLLAVDCDEVMVEFAFHVQRWLPTLGYRMELTQYRLEGSMFRKGDADPLPFDDCIALLDRFFTEETEKQQPVDGAVDALARLNRDAQVIVLTNVPRLATSARRRNIDAIGMSYPLVVNSGGKGRALAWLAARADAPTAFIDDSPQQLAHAEKHAPHVHRIHFVGASAVRSLLTDSPDAHDRAHDWAEAEAMARAALGL